MQKHKRYAGAAVQPDGTPCDGATVEFRPKRHEVRIVGDHAVIPRQVTITAGVGGAFEVDLIPGDYLVIIRSADGRWEPTFPTLVRENTDETDWLKTVEANP